MADGIAAGIGARPQRCSQASTAGYCCVTHRLLSPNLENYIGLSTHIWELMLFFWCFHNSLTTKYSRNNTASSVSYWHKITRFGIHISIQKCIPFLSPVTEITAFQCYHHGSSILWSSNYSMVYSPKFLKITFDYQLPFDECSCYVLRFLQFNFNEQMEC